MIAAVSQSGLDFVLLAFTQAASLSLVNIISSQFNITCSSQHVINHEERLAH